MFKYISVFLFTFLCWSCSQQTERTGANTNSQIIKLSYAKRFTIKKEKDYTVLELFGNKQNNDVTATFILYKNQKPDYNKEAFFVKTPVKRVASMSSIYTTMIEKLNELKSVIAIDNIDYYNNASVQTLVEQHKITELSKGPHIEVEKTLALNPDLLLTFGMGNPKNDVDAKLLQANLPIAISLDHLEETPLARYEWIKFIACFFDKEAVADSLFKKVETHYKELKTLTEQSTIKPKVLTEMKYGDVWHVPGGKSFISNLLRDAGANYIWKDDNQTGSITLSFENVYAKAKDCDVWINMYNVNSKKELTSYDERYSLFKAFKEDKLFNNNKIQNSKGFSNYWEEGISNPDEALADLIYIFHPDLLPNHQFTFYKKIE